MKNYTTLIILLFSLILSPFMLYSHVTDWGKANPEAPKEISQFDFIIGKWKLYTYIQKSENNYAESRATLTARYIMDGQGIMIETKFPTPASDFLSNVVLHYPKAWAV